MIKEHVSLKNYSTFGIGGNARYFTEVTSEEGFKKAFAFSRQKKVPFFVLGKGSNSLFSDEGFDGLVILNKMQKISIEKTRVKAESGASFSLLGVQTARKGLSGLEFASGIPATVGGAVFMNAGASGSEVCDVLKRVRFLPFDGEAKEFFREELKFAYRASPFHHMRGAILEAEFELKANQAARSHQKQIIEYRTSTQPYGEKSCGCIFRNPEGNAAGALIEKCGLKGAAVGEASVSDMHANFIVNKGNARARDVLELIEKVRKEVEGKTGIHLECEVRQVPPR